MRNTWMCLNKNRKPVFAPLIVLLAGIAGATTAWAQVVPSAYRGADTLWVGADYSSFDASFPYQSNQRLQGLAAFVDFNLTAHWGFEGGARFLSFGGFEGVTEKTYLAGPAYRFRRRGKFQPYAQGLLGLAKNSLPLRHR